MLINLRNALMTGKRLPYDAEVEYLQSSGTQYIDTLVNADSNLSVEITMANAGTPWTNVNPMGAILATPRCRHHLNFDSSVFSSGVSYYFGNGDSCRAVSGYKPSDGEIFTFKVDAASKTFTLGSFLGTFPNDTFDTGLSYWLFGRNGTTPPYLGALRIYSAKLWNGNTLVRDYIPVRVGNTGELYDRVSGKFAERHGDFQYGQDVVPVNFVDGEGYILSGAITTAQGLSRIDDYLPVIGGHSITFNYGGAANANCSLIVYNSSKTRIDYWGASSTNERTITMNANGAFVRYSVYEGAKQTAYLRDNTTGEYIMINGKRIVE